MFVTIVVAGKKVQHKSAGCSVCSTSKDCKSDSGIQCDCDYDVKQRQLAPYLTELDIRHKALLYSTFPDKEVRSAGGQHIV